MRMYCGDEALNSGIAHIFLFSLLFLFHFRLSYFLFHEAIVMQAITMLALSPIICFVSGYTDMDDI